MTASLLRLDAVRLMKGVLASTATQRFQDVMEAAFGGEEPPELHKAFEWEVEEEEKEGAEVEEVNQPGTSFATLSQAMKRKLPPSDAGSAAKRKGQHSVKGGLCSLSEADCIYPTTADSDNKLHSGVDPKFLSKRHSSSITKEAGYTCQYSNIMKSEGKIMPECNFFSLVKAQLSTHVCQFHLGAAVTCYVCQKKWWSAAAWYKHMTKIHTDLSSKDYYVKEGTNVQELQQAFAIKKEVTGDDL